MNTNIHDFEQMIEGMGIHAYNNSPGALHVDITKATPASVLQFLELIDSSGVTIQPFDAHCFARGTIEMKSIEQYIREHAGDPMFTVTSEEILPLFSRLWKLCDNGSSRPNWDEQGVSYETDDTSLERKRQFGNASQEQIDGYAEWGIGAANADEEYVQSQIKRQRENEITSGL